MYPRTKGTMTANIIITMESISKSLIQYAPLSINSRIGFLCSQRVQTLRRRSTAYRFSLQTPAWFSMQEYHIMKIGRKQDFSKSSAFHSLGCPQSTELRPDNRSPFLLPAREKFLQEKGQKPELLSFFYFIGLQGLSFFGAGCPWIPKAFPAAFAASGPPPRR